MAGVSVDYYTRLEQGRERHPSPAILTVLARTLQLDPEEARHLRLLAGHAVGLTPGALPPGASSSGTPGAPGEAGPGCAPEQVRGLIAELLGAALPRPAYVLSPVNDVLAANDAALALLVGLDQWPAERRNTIRYIFLHPAARTLFADWPRIAADAVAHLHAISGLAPDDPALAALVAELSRKSEEFPRLWAERRVRALAVGRKAFAHPRVGPMTLDYEVLDVARSRQRLVVYGAASGSPDHDAMVLLTAGTPSMVPVAGGLSH